MCHETWTTFNLSSMKIGLIIICLCAIVQLVYVQQLINTVTTLIMMMICGSVSFIVDVGVVDVDISSLMSLIAGK